MSKKVIAGVDWSITSPAITVYDSSTEKYTFYGFFNTKKQEKLNLAPLGFHISEKPLYPEGCDIARFDKFTDWAVNILKVADHVIFEEYAFAANGNITGLAECCGLLKYKLYKLGIPFSVVISTSLKKFATGKGNAKKNDMVDAFSESTGINILTVFEENPNNKKITAPITDICDSYWLVKYGQENEV